jgi:uncharacterized protein YndB with AHSA1/START domain
MIRLILRLAIVAIAAAWMADTVLRRRARDAPPDAIRLQTVIDAPIDRVWAALVDIEGQPRWMHDMKSVRMDDPGAIGVGSRGEATVRMYGISVSDPVTITALEPPTRFGIAHDGAFSGTGLFELEDGPNGNDTTVRWEEALVAPVLPHLGAAVTGPVFRRVFAADLERFRVLVEAGG